jgi:hypothetical protein
MGAYRRVTSWAGAHLTRDHLTRVQSDPELQLDAVAPAQLIGDDPSLVLKVKRRQATSKSVVFEGDRSAEYRHDSVAGEIDSAPVSLDDSA